VGDDRLEQLTAMKAARPENALTRLMIVHELFKRERFEETVAEARDYLRVAKDEGAVYRLLGHALRRLGRDAEAGDVFLEGAEVAARHGHDGMAAEFRQEAGLARPPGRPDLR
jgi:Flp pilus assembly protein TadD